MGLNKANKENPDVILLNLILPGANGIEVCQDLRRNNTTAFIPVIILTTLNDESGILSAFKSGADDYIIKPFSPNELVARIKRIRRQQRNTSNKTQNSRICLGDLEIWPDRNLAFLSGKPIDLTRKEFELMNTFILNPNRIVSREYLLQVVWGCYAPESNRKVDVHVKSLRTKLQKIGTRIETIRGIGYRFRSGLSDHDKLH